MGKIEQPKNAVISELSRSEIEMILDRNHVGRLAFSLNNRVDIRPIHYVFRNSWVYGCTSKGSKLEAIGRNAWVAFEVDEVADTFDWRSVVIRGTSQIVYHTGSEQFDPTDTGVRDDPEYTAAVATLRTFIPDMMLASDPAPFRHTVFRIHLDEASGRECKPAAETGK